jgi:hypothetical protein
VRERKRKRERKKREKGRIKREEKVRGKKSSFSSNSMSQSIHSFFCFSLSVVAYDDDASGDWQKIASFYIYTKNVDSISKGIIFSGLT